MFLFVHLLRLISLELIHFWQIRNFLINLTLFRINIWLSSIDRLRHKLPSIITSAIISLFYSFNFILIFSHLSIIHFFVKLSSFIINFMFKHICLIFIFILFIMIFKIKSCIKFLFSFLVFIRLLKLLRLFSGSTIPICTIVITHAMGTNSFIIGIFSKKSKNI